MKPKIKNTLAWEQAQLLMQPVFIRVLDNIRKQLEDSSWKGTYREVQTPYPGYHLCLTHEEQSVEVDIWELCYQVCFRDYNSSEENALVSREVEIDTSLIDEIGEVDWQRLDDKARQRVAQVFANLPFLTGE